MIEKDAGIDSGIFFVIFCANRLDKKLSMQYAIFMNVFIKMKGGDPVPKIIAELRADLLEKAREVLFREGYEALTMRGIAGACSVAVGTVYNYFPSKDMLVASVTLEDWQKALGRMASLPPAATAADALEGVFRELMGFYDRYSGIWREYTAAGYTAPVTGPYHKQLVKQLSGMVEAALAPFAPLCAPALPGFLAETLLSAAAGGWDRFDALRPILARLL